MKNFKILFLFILFLALFLEGINGQTDRGKSKNNNDASSEKSKVIVFGDDEEENQNSKSKIKKYTIIKTNPFSSILGHQVLEIERELTNVLSFQVGLGLTFNNYLQLDNDIIDFFFWDDDIDKYQSANFNRDKDITDYHDDDRILKPGLIFSLSTRFFLDADGFTGQYFSPVYSFRGYNFQTAGIIENRSILEYDPNSFDEESRNITTFSIRYGYQYYFNSNITLDIFFGFGIKSKTERRQDLGYNNLGIVVREFQTLSKRGLLSEFGLRVGYHF